MPKPEGDGWTEGQCGEFRELEKLLIFLMGLRFGVGATAVLLYHIPLGGLYVDLVH